MYNCGTSFYDKQDTLQELTTSSLPYPAGFGKVKSDCEQFSAENKVVPILQYSAFRHKAVVDIDQPGLLITALGCPALQQSASSKAQLFQEHCLCVQKVTVVLKAS